ncbi:SPOC like C-terminal domain-containing protein [Peziza echinospora]|nr:SPOC like C-terminal domain-containing protein [Peziza echinospora]
MARGAVAPSLAPLRPAGLIFRLWQASPGRLPRAPHGEATAQRAHVAAKHALESRLPGEPLALRGNLQPTAGRESPQGHRHPSTQASSPQTPSSLGTTTATASIKRLRKMSSDNKWRPQDDEADEEEEDDVDAVQYQNLKDAILFAIDVSPSMLSTHTIDDDAASDSDSGNKKKAPKPKSQPTSAVKTALQCAFQVLQQRIISNPNDMMGILLYGTDKTQFPEGGNTYQNCYLLLDLDVPDAPGIKDLKRLIEDDTAFEELTTPAKTPPSISTVLFAANQLFTTKASNFHSRRLFLITDNDDPHAADKALKNSAITRARDLYDLGVRIDPFYISNPGKDEFDLAKFYDDIIYRSSTNDDDGAVAATSLTGTHLKASESLDGKVRLQSMLSTILSKAVAKRALFSLHLQLAPGFEIGVKGYNVIKRQQPARSHYVYTALEKPQIVKAETTQLADDTARIITDKAEIKKAYKFGGETVLFDMDEMKEVRALGPPSAAQAVLRVIGFKPARMLRFMDNVKPAVFLYPSEEEFIGSTRVFSSLWQNLAEKDVVAITWFVARKNASPVIAALVPSRREKREKKEKDVDASLGNNSFPPQGIFLIQLPFANDIRQNPDVPVYRSPAPLTDAMRRVVKQLHLPRGYRPEKVSNPALQWHYRILQAVALDEEMPEVEEVQDKSKPKYSLIRRHAGEWVKAWGAVLDEVGDAEVGGGGKREMSLGSRKRGAAEEGGDGPRKASRTASAGVGISTGGGGGAGVEGPSDQDVRAAVKRDTVNKFTVVQLKAWLASKRLDTSGKKADLVERVGAWWETRGG